MDLYVKKIMGFLQANPNLDLEAADIAFHLKMDEQFVQNYMSSLLRQGVVINKRNEYGRIYWYAPTRETPETEIPVMEPPSTAPLFEKIVIEKKDEFDEFLENEEKRLPILKILFSVALIAAFGALAYLGLESVNRKINTVANLANSIHKEAVLIIEFNQFKSESSSKIQKLETDIRGLTSLVDSLKEDLEKNKNEVIETKNRKTGKKRK